MDSYKHEQCPANVEDEDVLLCQVLGRKWQQGYTGHCQIVFLKYLSNKKKLNKYFELTLLRRILLNIINSVQIGMPVLLAELGRLLFDVME